MAKIDKDVADSLDKITSYLQPSVKDITAVVAGMKKQLESESHGAKINAVSSTIKTLGGSIESFKSGDVTKILSSVLDITASISTVIPEVGPIISAVCTLFSAILGIFGYGGQKSIAEIVKEAIEEALNNYDDAELRAEVQGTERVYRDSLAFLNFDAGTKLSETQANALTSNVPIYDGFKMLGILQSKIIDNAKKKDLTQGKRAIAYTNLYVKLAILRSAILIKMQTLIKSSGHSSEFADAIKRVADEEEANDKSFITFLTMPTYDMEYMFVQLTPSKEPLLQKFLTLHGLHFQNNQRLIRSKHSFRPEKWTDFFMVSGEQWMGASKTKGPEGNFTFEEINLKDSLFYIRPEKYPRSYVRMVKDCGDKYCEHSDNKPEKEGKWKVIKFRDGKYMLSPTEWPDVFAYMANNGYIYGCQGDPGSKGHWIID